MTDLERFTDMLHTHERIVFFGGAGVSTESNIPDFRGQNGLYRQAIEGSPWTPEEMLSHHFFEEHPTEFFSLYKEREGIMLDAKPNRAHYALATLENMGKLSAVVTQNIDGLHQKAGSQNVIELHGSVWRNICQKCGKAYDMEKFLALCEPIPYCVKCGGVVKPDVVLYEEPLDTDVIDDAVRAISQGDMLIIGGTSLAVYPAAGFIRYFGGDVLVIVNRDETREDDRCDLLFRNSVGEVLEKGVKGLLNI